MHPADRIRGARSGLLSGKRIVLAVTGSIAAVESVRLARELIRHGAEVTATMSRAAEGILHPDALHFATGRPVVRELSGAVEHLSIDPHLLLVAPCTGNALAKVVHGIHDSAATTFASATLGRRPVLVVPAMDEEMWENPAHRENLERFARLGGTVVPPRLEEGKAKVAEVEDVVAYVLRALGPGTLRGKRVLVVAGGTEEPIDAMRVVSNRSTGATGAALATEAFRLGADVELWLSSRSAPPPRHLPAVPFATVDDLLAMAAKPVPHDWVLVPAAISDFRPVPAPGKIPSGKDRLDVGFTATPKFLERLKPNLRGRLVSFKAEADVSDSVLVSRARGSASRYGSWAVVANRLEDVSRGGTRVAVVTSAAERWVTGTKEEVARGVWSILLGG
ncbi:MAG: bifunctional phosphopantothenoylcysteine decarboxylase/phosphopantothenate--cysteine ligase CoaBC [Methanobacteriota archaeon]